MAMFSQQERERLQSFFEACHQINEASIVSEGQSLSFSVSARETEEPQVSFSVFGNEPFRSLAMSVRLVYLNDEPANFGGICNILYKSGPPELRDAVAEVRAGYNGLLTGNKIRFQLHAPFEGKVLGPRELLETWLYSVTFHQDPDRKAVYSQLKARGDDFTFALHLILIELVGWILSLGDIVASALAKSDAE